MSSAFEDGAIIPTRFTCDGEDVWPPLPWSNVPHDKEHIVIVVEDPDAPEGTFVHWIVAGIDPTTDGLDDGEVPEGANDFDEIGYHGPCPPRARPAPLRVRRLRDRSGDRTRAGLL